MVRLPSWGCISMSVISKLSMLGAAGASGTPNFLVVVSGDSSVHGGVATFDYTDPQNLVLMDSIGNSDAARISHARAAAFDKENMLVVIAAHNGNDTADAYVVDVSDPYNLSVISSNLTTSTYTMYYAQKGRRVGLDVANKKAYFSNPFGANNRGQVFRLNYSSSSVSANTYESVSYIDDPRSIMFDTVNNYVWVWMDDDNSIRVFDQNLNYINTPYYNTYVRDFFLDTDNSRLITNRAVTSSSYELYPSSASPGSKIDSLNLSPQVSTQRGFAVDTVNKNIFNSNGYKFEIVNYSSDNLSRLSLISSLTTTYAGESPMGYDSVNNYVVHGGRDLAGASNGRAALSFFDVSNTASPTQLATYSTDDTATSSLGSVVFTVLFTNE